MAREVLENCHKTISASYVALGQSMGQTLLPQPPANMLVRRRTAPARRHRDAGPARARLQDARASPAAAPRAAGLCPLLPPAGCARRPTAL